MRTISASLQAARRPAAAVALLLLVTSNAVARSQAAENAWTTSIRGVVLDSETKKPIPLAVVYVDRDPPERKIGGLREKTDGEERGQQLTTGADGRFVFQGLDFRPHFFSAGKEGYISATNKPRYVGEGTLLFSSYEVHTGPDMGEIRMLLTPAAKIVGRVISEAGQPMKNALLTLYGGVVEDGRTVWQRRTVLATDGNGFYSFANLSPGTYAVLSDWIFDNDPDPPHGTDCGTTRFTPTGGYPPSASPGLLNFRAAQPIHLGAGRVESVDFRLPHREFHFVTWIHNADTAPGSFSSLRDGNGRNLRMVPPPESRCGRSMPVTLERGNGPPNNMLIGGRETIHLPDGEYTLTLRHGYSKDEGPGKFMSLWLGTFTNFTVEGKPIIMSYPHVSPKPNPAVAIHVQIDMGAEGGRCTGLTSSAFSGSDYDDGKPSYHTLWLTRADPLPVYEQPIPESISREGKSEFYSLEAGKYWVHAVEPGESGPFAAQTNTYVASVTAGGVDMAKEPLVVGLDGTAAPLEVTARYHCGILHLKYSPANPYQERYGIVRSFYGLLVPQFSAFETVHSFLFEPGRPQEITVGNLTPGHYKFYVSSRERGFAFRESTNAPADLGTGEDVWLKAGEKADVSVAEPPES